MSVDNTHRLITLLEDYSEAPPKLVVSGDVKPEDVDQLVEAFRADPTGTSVVTGFDARVEALPMAVSPSTLARLLRHVLLLRSQRWQLLPSIAGMVETCGACHAPKANGCSQSACAWEGIDHVVELMLDTVEEGLPIVQQDRESGRTPLLPRIGWVMPEAPAPGLRPYTHLVGPGDGWTMFWATPQQAFDGDYWTPEGQPNALPAEISWPFLDGDVATRSDMERVGFFDFEEEEHDPSAPISGYDVDPTWPAWAKLDGGAS